MQRRSVDPKSSVIRFSSHWVARCSTQHAADGASVPQRSPRSTPASPARGGPFPAGLGAFSSGLLERGEAHGNGTRKSVRTREPGSPCPCRGRDAPACCSPSAVRFHAPLLPLRTLPSLGPPRLALTLSERNKWKSERLELASHGVPRSKDCLIFAQCLPPGSD